MNVEQLQLVKRTKTADTVLRFLSKRERTTNDTNLDSFRAFLLRNNFQIDKDEFYGLFQDLEDVGVGTIVEYQGKPGKFLWKYSLKDVSEQILYPNKMIELTEIKEEPIEEVPMVKEEPLKVSLSEIAPMPIEKKRGRGRPPGAKNKSTLSSAPVAKKRGRPPGVKNKSVQTEVNKPVERSVNISSSSRGSKEIILLYTTTEGDILPIKLEEAERLAQQVAAIKQKRLI